MNTKKRLLFKIIILLFFINSTIFAIPNDFHWIGTYSEGSWSATETEYSTSIHNISTQNVDYGDSKNDYKISKSKLTLTLKGTEKWIVPVQILGSITYRLETNHSDAGAGSVFVNGGIENIYQGFNHMGIYGTFLNFATIKSQAKDPNRDTLIFETSQDPRRVIESTSTFIDFTSPSRLYYMQTGGTFDISLILQTDAWVRANYGPKAYATSDATLNFFIKMYPEKAVVTPEPTSIILFISGIGGLICTELKNRYYL